MSSVPSNAFPDLASGVSQFAGSEAFAIGDFDRRLLTTAGVAVRHLGDAL